MAKEINKALEKLYQLGNETICPVAILIKDGKILCGLRHYKADEWKDISVWTCPGGRCDTGETIEETLRRETAEETGITEFKILDYIREVPGAEEGDIVPVFACVTSQSPVLMEPEKFSEWRWFSPKDIPENFINNEVRKIIISLRLI